MKKPDSEVDADRDNRIAFLEQLLAGPLLSEGRQAAEAWEAFLQDVWREISAPAVTDCQPPPVGGR